MKIHDGVETLNIQEDWTKTRKKLIETASPKPPGLIVAYVSKTDRLDLLLLWAPASFCFVCVFCLFGSFCLRGSMRISDRGKCISALRR
jgi:hypothetical protein